MEGGATRDSRNFILNLKFGLSFCRAGGKKGGAGIFIEFDARSFDNVGAFVLVLEVFVPAHCFQAASRFATTTTNDEGLDAASFFAGKQQVAINARLLVFFSLRNHGLGSHNCQFHSQSALVLPSHHSSPAVGCATIVSRLVRQTNIQTNAGTN